MKIVLSNKIKSYWITSTSYYSMGNFEKFMKYFFPFIEKYQESNDVIGDINIYDIQETEIPQNKINVLLCVENCNFWKHYKHFNKYGNYNDPNIKIYLYNHLDKIFLNEKIIAIPIIYLQMDYLKKHYNTICPTIYTPFNQKKFCLIATTINNNDKKNIELFLNSIKKCDNIKNYSHIINNKSCYHSEELLNIFNQYKFVFVCENSIGDGYITEKIFNCFFSRTIPIYFGSKKIEYFINNNSFINIKQNNFSSNIKIINELTNNKIAYDSFINNNIVNNFDNENYAELIKKYLF